MNSKTILYIAMSMDGFISSENDNIDFLNPYQIEGEDYGYQTFIDSVSHILVGRRTFEVVQAMGFQYHPDKTVYVATRSNAKSNNKNLIFYNGKLESLISQIKSTSASNIYCDGGAELANSLISKGLIDEIILSIIPVKLKTGIVLFENGRIPSTFTQTHQFNYQNGLVQHHYQKNGYLIEDEQSTK